jgi:soluble lytic murein transglycosylase-like protein
MLPFVFCKRNSLMIRCPRLSSLLLTLSLICAIPLTHQPQPTSPTYALTPAPAPAPKKETQYDKLVSFLSSHYKRPHSQVATIVKETVEQAQSKGIDPLLFLAVISVESNFNPNAVSNKGAIGLVQVMPESHPTKIEAIRRAGKKPTDIPENINMGVSILSEYRQIHNGDMHKALLRYNGSLRDKKGRYAAKIMAEHKRFETLAAPDPTPDAR